MARKSEGKGKKTTQNKGKNTFLRNAFWSTVCGVALSSLLYLLYACYLANLVSPDASTAVFNYNYHNFNYDRYTEALTTALQRCNSTQANDCAELADAMVQLGVILSTHLLAYNDAVENATTQSDNNNNNNKNKYYDQIVVPSLERKLARAFTSYYHPAMVFSLDALYQSFAKINVNKNNKTVPMSETLSLPWQWIVATVYSFTIVAPEFFLAVDDTVGHGAALVSGLHLLIHASDALSNAALPAVFAIVSSSFLSTAASATPSGAWRESERGNGFAVFCNNTFSSLTRLELRRAAVLEELIALHSDFAPLRLHYSMALALMNHPNAAAQLKQEREKIGNRTHVDAMHDTLTVLAEAYVTVSKAKTSAKVNSETVLLSLYLLGSCERLRRPFDEDKNSWSTVFATQKRPDLMDWRQARRILNALRAVVPAEAFPESLAECM